MVQAFKSSPKHLSWKSSWYVMFEVLIPKTLVYSQFKWFSTWPSYLLYFYSILSPKSSEKHTWLFHSGFYNKHPVILTEGLKLPSRVHGGVFEHRSSPSFVQYFKYYVKMPIHLFYLAINITFYLAVNINWLFCFPIMYSLKKWEYCTNSFGALL